MKWAVAGLAGAASLVAGQAQAQAVFSGDCDRARAIQTSIPLSQRFTGAYKGVTVRAPDNDACGRTDVRLWDLTPRSSAADKVVYDVKRFEYVVKKTRGTCPDAEFWSASVYGTLTFNYLVVQQSGYCDLRVTARFDLVQSNSTWKYSYTQRVTFLSTTHFSVSAEGLADASIFYK